VREKGFRSGGIVSPSGTARDRPGDPGPGRGLGMAKAGGEMVDGAAFDEGIPREARTPKSSAVGLQ
jgi:hypothetical protein